MGGIAPFWGSANLPLQVSRAMGYCSSSIAISRDMGPLSPSVFQFEEPESALVYVCVRLWSSNTCEDAIHDVFDRGMPKHGVAQDQDQSLPQSSHQSR